MSVLDPHTKPHTGGNLSYRSTPAQCADIVTAEPINSNGLFWLSTLSPNLRSLLKTQICTARLRDPRMYQPITDSKQGVIKGGQNPNWFGRRFGFRQTLPVELFKATTTMDLMVVLQCFQMADHFGSHRRILLDPLFNFGGQRMSKFQRSVFGKEQMEFHPIRIARIALPQPMKRNSGFGSHLDE